MSLWYKPVTEIAFADVDAFCQAKIKEGLRLDYKSEMPKDLAKTVAAFANTLGGLILIGVEATKENEPIWPPKTVLASGISEQITQTCQDAIYPPVRPQIQIVPCPDDPQQAIAVVRIDESAEAPHAIASRTKVYIRTGDVNKPIDLADIDRIKYHFDRRNLIEVERESLIRQSMERAERLLPKSPRVPTRWASVVPVFPWRDHCAPSVCYSFLQQEFSPQRAPAGAIALQELGYRLQFTDLDGQPAKLEPSAKCRMTSASSRGLIFVSERMVRDNQDYHDRTDRFLRLLDCLVFFKSFFNLATLFFRQRTVESPGYLQVSIGLKDVALQRMESMHHCGRPFPDDEYRDDQLIAPVELLERPTEDQLNLMSPFEDRLFRGLAYSFDVNPHGWKVK